MHSPVWSLSLAIVLLTIAATQAQRPRVLNATISTQDLTVLVGEQEPFVVSLSGILSREVRLTFRAEHEDMVDVLPSPIHDLKPGVIDDLQLWLLGKSPGHLQITAEVSPNDSELSVDQIFLRVTVAISNALIYVSEVVGWIYFVAWSVSFWPQIWINYKRKSVVGLNFDFLALNIVGFLMYSIFNMGLFWNEYIETEYFRRNPRGLNPVQINDLVFAVHAMLATMVTISQCFIYTRDEQRVSWIARGILGIFAVAVVVFAILAGTAVIHWLDFLYYCSYIKLSITLIKYIPQAVMNYRRKSTVGWSIGNIFLDFTGGSLSMLQMILNAYNYDDWASIFGDATKFGLGLFSVLFDIFFIVQHYGLYSNAAADESTGVEKHEHIDDGVLERLVVINHDATYPTKPVIRPAH